MNSSHTIKWYHGFLRLFLAILSVNGNTFITHARARREEVSVSLLSCLVLSLFLSLSFLCRRKTETCTMTSNRKRTHRFQTTFQTYRVTCESHKTKKNHDAKPTKQDTKSHVNQQNKKTAKVNKDYTRKTRMYFVWR